MNVALKPRLHPATDAARTFADDVMAGLMAEVVEEHVRTHLVDEEKNPGALNKEAAEQLLDVVRSYLK